MYKTSICKIAAVIIVSLLSCNLAPAKDIKGDSKKDLSTLFNLVEKLKIKRNKYVLGAVLNPEQIKTAESHPVDSSTPGTFKFRDNNLFVVVEESSKRIIIIYELFENADQSKAKDLIGDLFMNFEDPTVMAHDKIVYWAYTEKGKISSREFNTAKKDKKNLDIIATIKFISEINIMEKIKESDPATGQIYYIISSDPILKFFN